MPDAIYWSRVPVNVSLSGDNIASIIRQEEEDDDDDNLHAPYYCLMSTTEAG